MTDPAELRRLLDEATPLPWQHRWAWRSTIARKREPLQVRDDRLAVAAVNALPELLDRIAELEETVERLEDALAVRQKVAQGYLDRIDKLEAAVNAARWMDNSIAWRALHEAIRRADRDKR